METFGKMFQMILISNATWMPTSNIVTKKKLKTCTIYEQPQNSKILNTILAYQITTKTLVFNTKKYK